MWHTIEKLKQQVKWLKKQVDCIKDECCNDSGDGQTPQSNFFLGTFDSLLSLTAAHPTPLEGSRANIEDGVNPVQYANWDTDNNIWVVSDTPGLQTVTDVDSTTTNRITSVGITSSDDIIIEDAGSSFTTRLLVSLGLTNNRTLRAPDKSGTIAIEEDVPANTSDLVNDGSDGEDKYVQFGDLYAGNSIIEGGVIYLGTGFNYKIWATRYIINGQLYEDPVDYVDTDVVLTPAIAQLSFDVFAVDNGGGLPGDGTSFGVVVPGVEDASPELPELDGQTQVQAGFRLMTPGETEPGEEITNLIIYNEDLGLPDEWNKVVIPSGGNSADNSDFFAGTVSYNLPTTVTTDILRFDAPSEVAYQANNSLVFAIKLLDNRWENNDRLRIRLVSNSGSNSPYFNITGRNVKSYGVNRESVGVWQVIQLPFFRFNYTSPTFTGIQFKLDMLSTDIQIDFINIQGGIFNPSLGDIPERTSQLLNDGETGASRYIEEAPVDSTPYVRQDGDWLPFEVPSTNDNQNIVLELFTSNQNPNVIVNEINTLNPPLVVGDIDNLYIKVNSPVVGSAVPDTNWYILKNQTKGTYGLNETQITTSDLVLISVLGTDVNSIGQNGNTQVINLGNVGSNDIVTAWNNHTFTGSEDPVQGQNIGYVLINVIINNQPLEYLFVGDSGNYGTGGTDIAALEDFVLLTDIESLQDTQFINLGEIGNQAIEDAFNTHVFTGSEDPVQSQSSGYVVVNTLVFGVLVQYLFVGAGGNYGIGGTSTAVALDFVVYSPFDSTTPQQDYVSNVQVIGNDLVINSVGDAFSGVVPLPALSTPGNNYVADVQWDGTNLNFTAVGTAFSGAIPLTGLSQDNINRIEDRFVPDLLGQTLLDNINNGSLLTVAETENQYFQFSSNTSNGPVTEIWVLKDTGKGTYGTGGSITVTKTNLRKISSLSTSTGTIIGNPNTQFINLGDLAGQPVQDVLNAENPSVTIQAQNVGFVVIDATNGGDAIQYLFIGDGGDYGVGGTETAVTQDFLLLTDVEQSASTQVINLGEIANAPVEDIFNLEDLSGTNPIQDQNSGYVIVKTLVNGVSVDYFFIGAPGDYGSVGGTLTAVDTDFLPFSPYIEDIDAPNLTWQHTSGSGGGSSSVIEKLIPGEATSFTQAIVHNGPVLATELVGNLIKNKGTGSLNIVGNQGMTLTIGNANEGSVRVTAGTIGDYDADAEMYGIWTNRPYNDSAPANNSGNVRLTGFTARDVVDLSNKQGNGWNNVIYAAFNANPIVTGSPAEDIYSLYAERGRVFLGDYTTDIIDEAPVRALAVGATGRVVTTALGGGGGNTTWQQDYDTVNGTNISAIAGDGVSTFDLDLTQEGDGLNLTLNSGTLGGDFGATREYGRLVFDATDQGLDISFRKQDGFFTASEVGMILGRTGGTASGTKIEFRSDKTLSEDARIIVAPPRAGLSIEYPEAISPITINTGSGAAFTGITIGNKLLYGGFTTTTAMWMEYEANQIKVKPAGANNTLRNLPVGFTDGTNTVYADGTSTVAGTESGVFGIVDLSLLNLGGGGGSGGALDGGVSGLFIADRNPANYGSLGSNSIDLSISTTNAEGAGATGDASIAMGTRFEDATIEGAKATNYASMSFMGVASGITSQAIGWNSVASGDTSIALGRESNTSSRWGIAIGRQASSTNTGTNVDDSSIAIGNSASVTADGGVAIGTESQATGQNGIAIGNGASAGPNQIVLGSNTGAYTVERLVVGNYVFDVDQSTSAAGGHVLTFDDSDGLIRLLPSGGGGSGLQNVVEDLTPQLGGNLDLNGNEIRQNFDTVFNGGVTGATTVRWNFERNGYRINQFEYRSAESTVTQNLGRGGNVRGQLNLFGNTGNLSGELFIHNGGIFDGAGSDIKTWRLGSSSVDAGYFSIQRIDGSDNSFEVFRIDPITDGIVFPTYGQNNITGTPAYMLTVDSSGNVIEAALPSGGGATPDLQAVSDEGSTTTNTLTAANFILSSDERLKENIKDVSVSHIDVSWKTFNLIDSPNEIRYGVIAQELEEKHPEFVTSDDRDYKAVKYVDLLIAKIAELETRIKTLEA
jgi:hypothetical protein